MGYPDSYGDGESAEREARTAFRRRRAATAGLAAVAVVAIVAGGVFVARNRGADPATIPGLGANAAPTETASVAANDQTPTTTPTAAPTLSDPATATPAQPTTKSVTRPAQSNAAARLPELKVAAASVITFRSDGTVYRGYLTVKVTNTGGPYGYTGVVVGDVLGVEMVGDSGFNGCSGQPGNWLCYGASIPAGGTVEQTIELVAAYAPLSTSKTIEGFFFRYVPFTNGGVELVEGRPDDNRAAFTIVLPAVS